MALYHSRTRILNPARSHPIVDQEECGPEAGVRMAALGKDLLLSPLQGNGL
jgi:hypothetical protein